MDPQAKGKCTTRDRNIHAHSEGEWTSPVFYSRTAPRRNPIDRPGDQLLGGNGTGMRAAIGEAM